MNDFISRQGIITIFNLFLYILTKTDPFYPRVLSSKFISISSVIRNKIFLNAVVFRFFQSPFEKRLVIQFKKFFATSNNTVFHLVEIGS